MKTSPLPLAAWPAFFAAALLAMALPAHGWDPAGHMLIGEIAWQKSSPTVREKVEQAVASLDHQYNEGRAYNFVTAGCWMDDMRSGPKYPWSPLHYISIPYTPTGSAFVEPPPPHILSAMDESLAVLKNPETSAADRAQALAMLIHYVGDVHQPLHTTEWNDRGGNGYLIAGVPFSDLMKKQLSNLHTYWDKAFRFDGKDGAIVETFAAPETAARPAPSGEGVIHDEALKIMQEFPPESLPQFHERNPRIWARESHLIGCIFAYPARPHPGNAEVVKLDSDFVHKALPIARERVALAGYRLAELLEQLLAK